MRTFLSVLTLLGLSAIANAQSSEIYGGFSYLRTDQDVTVSNHPLNLPGWEASYTGYIIPHFGIDMDFSGNYGPNRIDPFATRANYSQHSFLIGPSVRPIHTKFVDVALHGLVGASVGTEDFPRPFRFSDTETAFSAAVGGNIDVRVTDHIAYRILQPDYLVTRFGGQYQSNFRASTGFVFSFGR